MQNVWQDTLNSLRNDSSFGGMFNLMKKYGTSHAAEMLDENNKIISRTYDEYIEMSYNACGFLQKSGVKAEGKVIGLIYESDMDWPVLLWGILMTGNIPLLINPALDGKTISAIFREAVAVSYVSAKKIEECDITFIHSEKLLTSKQKGEEKWGKYIALCTSGTTNNSRIFLYDSQTLANHILSFDEAKKLNPVMPFIEGKKTKLLSFLPFHHVFGFSVVYLLYSCTGKTLVFLRNKSINTITDTCKKIGVTHLYCIPMFFTALANGIKKKIQKDDIHKLPFFVKRVIRKKTLGNSICSMITGGAHIPTETLDIINTIGYPLCNGFGMTETGIISVERSTDASQRIKGSIGIPFTVTEWKIDAEKGKPGELFIRGDALYTASMIDGKIIPRDKSKWFGTGDLVSEKPDGLYITGRCKDVIIGASGENIYPEEIEEVFSGICGVKSYAMLGIPKGNYDECALAVYAIPPYDENEILSVIRQRNENLSSTERVTTVYFSEKELPVSGNLKIKRLEIKKEIKDGVFAGKSVKLYSSEKSEAEKAEKPVSGLQNNENFAKILADVKKIAADVFEKNISEIGDYDNFITTVGVDSLSVLGALTEFENKFNIVITDDELTNIDCVMSVATLVYKRLYGEDVGTASRTEECETHRITNFSESKEFCDFRDRMAKTFADGANPYFIPHDSLIRDTSVINGKTMINLGSYNYLGMSGNKETMEAAIEAIKKYGTSASGSRTLAGEKTLYRELEKTIADWKHTEDAIVCTGGWATNLSFISSFMKKGDFILYDKLSHNSLTEGVKLSDAESKAFEHNNLTHLEEILKHIENKYNKVLIVVEGVYSMDGDIAPIPEFVKLKQKYKCFLMVDEAHSGGVLGEHGGGVDDYFGLKPDDVDIKYGTLSKALGTCGGFIAAKKDIVEYLRYFMNGFVFSAGISPPLAAACMKAIEIIRRDNSEVTKLHENIKYFVKRAKEEGMNTCLAGESAIVPVMIGSDSDAARISSLLMEKGVFVPPAMYPAVPMGQSRLRFTISSTHNTEQLEKAITETSAILKKEGLLK